MTTTSSIGTSSRTYSTIGAWHTAFANGGWIGECYNDTEFNETPSIGGSSAPNYEILRTATGQSAFNTNTNPLKYDQSKGVGLKTTSGYSIALRIGSFCTVQGLQIWNAGSGNNNATVVLSNAATSAVIDRCLLLMTVASNTFLATLKIGGGGTQTATNCVIINYNNYGVNADYTSNCVVANCTIVSPSDKTAAGYGIGISSQALKIVNTAVFGFTSGFSTGGSPTGSNNATDAASISFGSSNLTSKTYANQFTGVTSAAMDFTLKAGADLLNAGATDTTDIPAAIDIFGTSRPQGSAWDIGAHEKIVSSSRAYRLTTLGVG